MIIRNTSACVSAAGRLASSVNMSYTRDTTYAYSRHLLWGLAENTSALLVFCVPAIPLAFRTTSPMMGVFGALQAKVRPLVDVRRLTSNRPLGSSWPNDTSRDTSMGEWRENSQVHLKRLGTRGEAGADSSTHHPIQESGGDGTGQCEGTAIYGQIGILRTTEIEIIRTEVGDDLPVKDAPKRERSFLW